MKEDIILFSGNTLYLSLPQYYVIAPELHEFTLVLLHINEFHLSPYDKKFIDKQKFSKFFDYFFELTPFNSIQKRNLMYYIKLKNYIFSHLAKINPTAVISCGDMNLMSRMLSAWCIKNKKPYIIIQPSFIDVFLRNPRGLKGMAYYFIFNKILQIPKYRRQVKYFGNESQKTFLLLWSKYFINNPKRKNISLIGNPVLDDLFKNFSHERIIKKKVLICTQALERFFGKDDLELINEIYIEAVTENPDLTFILKIHPREPKDKYNRIFNSKKYSNVIILQEGNIYDLFEQCDIQISASSYTTFEAAASGIPVITINPNNNYKYTDHYHGEINIEITKKGEIRRAIDKALSEEYWQEFIQKRNKYFTKMLTYIDGNSSKHAVKAIKTIIRNNIKT